MRSDSDTTNTPRPWTPRPVLLAIGLACLVPIACSDSPAGTDRPAASTSVASVLNSNAPFQNWHQGFNHDTEGWYGEETEGALGWCGEIEQLDRHAGDLRPSAGGGYATVALGGCNDFWTTETGFFSEDLVNAPWAPGPDFSLFSDVWPASGFVYELDIYLDPSWTPNEPEPPLFNDQAPPGTVFTYVASVREIATDRFFYFAVPVLSENGGLSIFGHTIDESGWYTFRHLFAEDGGRLSVTFELASRSGGTLLTEPIATEFFGQDADLAELAVTELSSGYLWFAAIADGLELPIDEHRMRPGR